MGDGQSTGSSFTSDRHLGVMPGDGRKSITVREDTYQELQREKEAQKQTWDGLFWALLNNHGDQLDVSELVESVHQDRVDAVVVSMNEDVLAEIGARVAREVRDELQGGAF